MYARESYKGFRINTERGHD